MRNLVLYVIGVILGMICTRPGEHYLPDASFLERFLLDGTIMLHLGTINHLNERFKNKLEEDFEQVIMPI